MVATSAGRLPLGGRWEEAQAEHGQVGGFDRRRRAHQRVDAALGLGEGDDLPDVLLLREERGEPVDPEGEAGVRRGSVAEGVEEEAEPALGLVGLDPLMNAPAPIGDAELAVYGLRRPPSPAK